MNTFNREEALWEDSSERQGGMAESVVHLDDVHHEPNKDWYILRSPEIGEA